MLNFSKKIMLGMIHLAGHDPIKNAIEEVILLSEGGFTGCIVENYHNTNQVLIEVLKELKNNRPKDFEIGINILPNDYSLAFELASNYNASFIQLDHVAGVYELSKTKTREIDAVDYHNKAVEYSSIQVLGGVWPKYYLPVKDSDLDFDLNLGAQRTNAVVVTGAGTGKETPLEKIKLFNKKLSGHPLIIGAGVNENNILEQMKYANGAIIGSSLKLGNLTTQKIQKELVINLIKKLSQNEI
ncbi:MAG: BtpA/SgcQ family protein [Bacteroidia bacterium]